MFSNNIIIAFSFFLFLQALQSYWFKVLAFSNTSFHLTRSWMHFLLLFIFIGLQSAFISFYHISVGLSANLVDIGFHSYNFLTILSFVIRCVWPNQLILWAKRHNGAGYPPHLPSGCLFITEKVVQFTYSKTISISIYIYMIPNNKVYSTEARDGSVMHTEDDYVRGFSASAMLYTSL
jgi:hypothetical protein